MMTDYNLDLVLESISEEERSKLYIATLSIYNTTCFSEMYFELWRNDIPARKIDKFLSLLKKGDIVLDAGCGPGHHANYINKCGFDVYGVDLSASALHIGSKSFTGINFVIMNMFQTDFDDAYFDGIWSCASAVHLPYHLFIVQIQEFYRLLKPKGLIALTVSSGKKEHLASDGRYFYSFDSIPKIEVILTDIGFSIIEVEFEILEKTTVESPNLIGKWVTVYAKKHEH
jgi:SAM-dependent methyltransferase